MKKKDIYAYYFPNWHVDKRNEQWHGKGWTEWEVAKCARPRFENHYQPRVPLWGYEDEADPAVMAKKIDCAKKYGIKGFIFDTYYYDDGSYRMRCVDEGFLKAENAKDFEFSLMWCNHDAIYAHPSPRNIISPVLKSGAVTEESFIRITDEFIDKYFGLPNYTKIDGKILFTIYNCGKLVKELGGIDETARIIKDFRQRVRDKGLGEMHFCTLPAILEDDYDDKSVINDILVKIGVDEGVRYWWPIKYDDYRLTVDYNYMLDNGIEAMKEDIRVYDFPVTPHAMSGLDQSPRTIQSEMYENMNIYPWYAVVVNCTPENYERAIREMRKIGEADEHGCHFMTVCWNEWTEGNYIEPDEKYGYAYLEALKRAMEE